jgi:glycosyltransferase involved in cell wall biosynthesis
MGAERTCATDRVDISGPAVMRDGAGRQFWQNPVPRVPMTAQTCLAPQFFMQQPRTDPLAPTTLPQGSRIQPPPRRRVLFAAGALRGGGAEGQLHQLATALSELGHEVTVATLVTQESQSRYQTLPLRRGGAQTRAESALELVRANLRLAAVVRRTRPDVVITWLAVPTLMGATALVGTGIPWIAAVRNSEPEAVRFVPPRVLRILLRVALSLATTVIANSRSGLSGYRGLGLLSHSRTAVIGNCIDTTRFHPPSIDRRAQARARFGITPGAPMVAYVGRDAPEKGLELLVAAFAELPLFVRDPQIVVVGVRAERLVALAAAAGVALPTTVHVHPRMQNIEDVYMATDVLLMTSRREGSPNVVHEARACGVAIVSTDCGDVRETMLSQDRVVESEPRCIAAAVAEVVASRCRPMVATQPMSAIDCAHRWETAIGSIVESRSGVRGQSIARPMR